MKICMLTLTDVRSDLRIRKEAESLARVHDVVVCSYLGPEKGRRGATTFEIVDLPLVSKSWPSSPFFWLIKYAEFAVRSVRRIRQSKPTVVHGHEVMSALPSWIAARICGAKFVYDAHELELDRDVRINQIPWIRLLLKGWVRFLLRRADAVICASGPRADLMLAEYGVRVRPTPIVNSTPRVGLQVTSEPAWPFPTRKRHETRVVLYQGVVSVGRGIGNIVEAVASLPDNHVLVVVGDGGSMKSVRARTAQLAIEDRVRFTGRIPAEEVPGWIAMADVGVVIYRDTCRNNRYCAPNKLYDYCSLGVPVVASDLVGNRSIVERWGVGTLFDPEDPSSLADAVIRLTRDPQRYREYAAAADDLKNHENWERQEERLLDLYESLGD